VTDQATTALQEPAAAVAGAAAGAAAATAAPSTAAAAPSTADASDLVFFMDPLSLAVSKGESVKVTLFASGAKGVTSGTLNLSIDPKLTFKGAAAGDFLTGDAGSLEATPSAGGVTLTFKRKGATDSGTLAVLDVDTTAAGNAPILITGGQYLMGANPIPARVVNSLITVN
jgi:hypothetical protein